MIGRRLLHAVLSVLACFAGQANAKDWYYYRWDSRTPKGSPLPVFESMDDLCQAYNRAQSQQNYFVLGTKCYYTDRGMSWPTSHGEIEVDSFNCGDPHSKPKVTSWDAPRCECTTGYKADSWAVPLRCIPEIPPEPEPQRSSCRPSDGLYSGNPIFLAGAEKFRAEADWTDAGPAALVFERFYRSSWNSGRPGTASGLGQAWNHSHATQLQLDATSRTVAIIAPEGHQRIFSKLPSSAAWIADNSADSLTATPSAAETW